MYSAWTQHLKEPEDKKRFEGSVAASKTVLDRLKTIVSSLQSGLDQDEINKKYYESPSWAYRQAHNNGFRHALNFVNTIIDLDKQVIKENE